jgi:hypothetical protein
VLQDNNYRNRIVNIANPHNYSVSEIVAHIELFTGCKADYELVAKGGCFDIDITGTLPFAGHAGIDFGEGYLDGLLHKYYQPDEL